MAVTKIRKVSSTTLLVLLALSVLIFVLFFAGRSIATNKTKDVVARKSNLISVVVLVVSLILGYAIGSGEAIKGLNEASQTYNTSGWLKVTDMWLYSTYVLFVVTLGAVVWGGVSKRFLGK